MCVWGGGGGGGGEESYSRHFVCVCMFIKLYVCDVRTDGSSVLSLQAWTRSGDQGPKWKYTQIHIRTSGSTVFILEGLSGSGDDGDIAVDDITFNVDHCPAEVICDFEDDECGYTQDPTDQFDWSLRSGAAPSPVNRAPLADHTFGTKQGHYMLIRSSYPRRRGNKARLDSPPLDPTTGSCLQFWYNMHGDPTEVLNVYLRRQGVLGSPVWTRRGEQGTDWEVAQVTLRSALSFQITFEGVTGYGVSGTASIDDIVVKPGACPGEGNCDFEDSLCTWKNTHRGDTFDWLQGENHLLSGFMGMVLDHTLNTPYGVYMYINSASPRRSGDRAWLVSSNFDNSTARCLTLWYRMMNKAPLNIKVQPVGSQPVNLLTITQVCN